MRPWSDSSSSQQFVPPRYDNRFLLDITVAAWLTLAGAFCFALYEAITLYIDYENSCSQFLCGSDAIVLSSAILFFIASLWFVYLSYPEQLELDLACIEEFAVIDDISKRKSFGERFVYGSQLLMLMWLFLLSIFPFYVLVIWAFAAGYLSVAYFVSYFMILVTITLLILFWLAATFPENMILNNGHGSSYFYDICLQCCCGPMKHGGEPDLESCSGFWHANTGSDFLVGAWIFFVGAGLALVVAIYEVYLQWTNILIYAVLISAILIFVASALLVSSSYPGQFFSRFWWCTLTCQKGERWNVQTRGGNSNSGENRRLI